MKGKYTIRYESDGEGWFAHTQNDARTVFFSTFAQTPEEAKARLIRKVEHYQDPTAAPLPEEVEI